MLFTGSKNIVPSKSQVTVSQVITVRTQTSITISQKLPILEFQNLS